MVGFVLQVEVKSGLCRLERDAYSLVLSVPALFITLLLSMLRLSVCSVALYI